MVASEFHRQFGDNADFWGEDAQFSVEEWQEEVSNDDTRLGYWDWVLCQREQAEMEREDETA